MIVSEKNIKAFNAIYDFGLSDKILEELPKISERVTKVNNKLGANVIIYLYRTPKILFIFHPRFGRHYYNNTSYFGIALKDIHKDNLKLLNDNLPVNTGDYFFTTKADANGANPHHINDFLASFKGAKDTKLVNSSLVKLNFKKFTENFLKELKALIQIFVTGRDTYHNTITIADSIPPLSGIVNSPEELIDSLKTYIKGNHKHFFGTHKISLIPNLDTPTASVLEVYETFLKLLYPDIQVTKIETSKTGEIKNKSTLDVVHKSRNYTVIGLVAEHNNQRMALIGQFEQDRYYRRNQDLCDKHGFRWNLYSFAQDKFPDLYDYLDVGRIFVNFGYNAGEDTLNANVGALFELKAPKVISYELMKQHIAGRKDQLTLIDDDTIDRITKRELRRQAVAKEEADVGKKLKEKAEKLFKGLAKQKGEIKFNDMVLTADSVKYETEELSFSKGHSKTWLSDLLTRAANVRDVKHVNYDHVLTGFIAHAMSVQNSTISGKIGSVTFELQHTARRNAAGSLVTQYKLNGNRINKGEVQECLERAVCYQTQTDYDYFLSEVKKCSLRIHSYLQLGVDSVVYDELQGKQLQIKFLIERKKNKNYVIINKKSYLIKSINRFLSIEKKNNLMDMVELLLNEDIVEGIKLKDMKGIIEKATETFKNAVAKSEELLNKTVKMFKLELETTRVGGTQRTGYKIVGKKRTYFLEVENNNAHTNRCGVYDYATGQYVCIVDKSTAQVGKDKIVNRIFALHNDEKVATQIHTI